MNEIREILNFLPSEIVESVFVFCTFLLLGFYHINLLKRYRKMPETTIMGRHNIIRNEWVKLDKEGRELVIVQTMRNLIMSASFLASTAILLMVGFLGAAFTTDKLHQLTYSLNILGVESQSLWMFKMLIIVVTYFVSFFNFTIAIRSCVFLSMMSNLKGNKNIKNYDDALSKEVNRISNHYALGMRGFYISIPIILWLFGPVWMLLGSVLLLIVLKRID